MNRTYKKRRHIKRKTIKKLRFSRYFSFKIDIVTLVSIILAFIASAYAIQKEKEISMKSVQHNSLKRISKLVLEYKNTTVPAPEEIFNFIFAPTETSDILKLLLYPEKLQRNENIILTEMEEALIDPSLPPKFTNPIERFIRTEQVLSLEIEKQIKDCILDIQECNPLIVYNGIQCFSKKNIDDYKLQQMAYVLNTYAQGIKMRHQRCEDVRKYISNYTLHGVILSYEELIPINNNNYARFFVDLGNANVQCGLLRSSIDCSQK